MTRSGIDISHWNKIINYDYVVNDPSVQFIILKAGGSDAKSGQYTDPCFHKYYNEFNARGVMIGAYYFVGRKCITAEAGTKDAEHFMQILKGKKFLYPVVCDLEATSPKDKAGATEAVKAFCRTLEKNGYYAMLYASDISGYKERLNAYALTDFDKWVARYGCKPKYIKDYGIWQSSSTGSINGIIGKVDLDFSYKSYDAIIKRNGLNGV